MIKYLKNISINLFKMQWIVLEMILRNFYEIMQQQKLKEIRIKT